MGLLELGIHFHSCNPLLGTLAVCSACAAEDLNRRFEFAEARTRAREARCMALSAVAFSLVIGAALGALYYLNFNDIL